jgi:TonB-linked SusC/RagA family outer membrane protein
MNSKFTLIKTMLTVIGVLLFSVLQAQTRAVSGKVIAETDKLPVPGVTLTVKGHPGGTVTDINGGFSISAAKGDVLLFTSVGFITKQIVVGTASTIQVVMSDNSTNLNEVVVVGYGTQSRRTVTNAVAKLDTRVLENAPRANIGTALQGTVSGLTVVQSSGTPGATPMITLRGGTDYGIASSPLVVIDGIQRPYSDIASEDVASIDVLKDASATAIYGARANNGVILVTTKKGKAGSGEFTYKYTGGYNMQRKGYEYLNAADYLYTGRLGRLNSYLALAPAGTTTLTAAQLSAINGSPGYGLSTDPAYLASYDLQAETSANIGLLQQGWQDIDDPANPGNKLIFKDHSQDISTLLFKNSHTQDHFVSGMGGNEKGTYYASLDYYSEDGIIIGTSYNRYAGNFSGSYKLKPNLEITTATNLSSISQLGVANGSEINALYRNQAIWPVFNPWLDAAKTVPNPGNGVADGNPLYYLQKLQRSQETDRLTQSAALKWNITPALYAKLSGNIYYNQVLYQSFQSATQTYKNLLNGTYASTARDAIDQYSKNLQQTYNIMFGYTKSLGKHNFSLMASAEYLNNSGFAMNLDGQNAPTDNIPTANASVLFNAGTANSSSKAENRTISTFATLNYDYDNRFLLNAVIREDGESRLAYPSRIGYFPGVSIGWNMERETFYKNLGIDKVMSSFKPRASYGANGNVTRIGNYDVQGVYNATTNYGGAGTFYDQIPTNPSLHWEKSSTIDFGADMGFLKDKITLLFDYYTRNTTDQIVSQALPSYTGFGSITTNLGSYQNQGVDFTLKANLINSRNGFKLDMGIVASYVQSKVTKLPNNGQPNNRINGQQPLQQIYDPATGNLIWVGGVQEGQPIGQIYGYKQLGIFKDAAEVAAVAGNRKDLVSGANGPNLPAGAGGHIEPGDVNWQDTNGDGIIDSRDQVYLGTILPKWTGGFNFNASYKGLSLYTNFTFNTGNTIYNDFIARTDGGYQGTFNYTTRVLNAWSPTNTVTNVPKIYYADQVVGSKDNYTRGNNAGQVLNGNNSSLYESGNYLACREITLSYDIPKALLSHTKVLSRTRVFFSGNNLFYIKSFSGPTPEAPVDANSGAINGIYAGTYPTPKSFTFGIQATF